MGRKVDRFTKIPHQRAPAWYRLPIFVRALGAEIAIEADGEPIPVDGDWRVSLCRLLRIDGRDRGNSVRALETMAAAGLLVINPGTVEVRWSPDVRSTSGQRPVDTRSTPGQHPVDIHLTSASTQPLEIVKDTSPRQTDRQTIQTAQHAGARDPDHSLDQKRVLRAWHEVFATSEIPRSERLEQVTSACTRQATAEKGSLEAIARRTFERFKADPYTAQAKNRFALLASQVDNWVGPEPALSAAIPITRMQKLDAAYEADIRVRLTKLKKLFDERIALAADDPDRQARLAHEKKLEVWKLEAKLA